MLSNFTFLWKTVLFGLIFPKLVHLNDLISANVILTYRSTSDLLTRLNYQHRDWIFCVNSHVWVLNNLHTDMCTHFFTVSTT